MRHEVSCSAAVVGSSSPQIEQRNFDLLQRGGAAIVALIDGINAPRKEGATSEQLNEALELQRKAQWRLDFIAAENSMGFDAPQEAAKILGEAIDYARQGEVAVARLAASRTRVAVAAPPEPPAAPKNP